MQIYPPGTRIGHFEVASHPMLGGMGVVYFCLDHSTGGQPVALKTIRPELLPDRAARDRFLREGTAWVELGGHPHIVRCYKVEYIDPTAFLVLELIAKEQNMPDASLRSWLVPGKKLPFEQALSFSLQIAHGMQYATENIPGLVHRDLKPENILVGADKLYSTNVNRLRITDFGLIKTLGDIDIAQKILSEKELQPNQIQFTRGVGTPLYMAPELWRGEQVGIFTDIYALGCILNEMFTGQYSATGKTISELQQAHSSGKLSPIPDFVPEDVAEIIKICLALSPSKRYQDWNTLTKVLEKVYSFHTGQTAPQVISSASLSHEERVQSGWSYNAIGLAYEDLGITAQSINYFERALVTGQTESEKELSGAAFGNLGNAYLQLGVVRRAIALFEQQMILTREMGNHRGEGNALGNLGLAYAALGDMQRAIEYQEKCLEYYRADGNRRGEANILGNLGSAYVQLGETRKSIAFYEQQLLITREIGDRRKEGNALGNLGNAYLQLGDSQRAIRYSNEQILITREIGDRRGEGNALGNLGLAYASLGERQPAIKYFEQALEIDREIGDKYEEGAALGNLGSVYADLGDARRAIRYYEQAMLLAREISDRRREGVLQSSLGNAYFMLGETQQAIEYYEKGYRIRSEIGDQSGMATNLFNMALLYSQQGDPAQALRLAQEAESTFERIGHSEYTRRTQAFITQLQNETNIAHQVSATAIQAAFEEFQRAASPEAMQAAIHQYPFMMEPEFYKAIEQLIAEQVPIEKKPAFEQRLTWLIQKAEK